MAFMDYMPQFGQNTNEQPPADDAQMQMEMKRRMAFANSLRDQQMPQGQMVSGHYVAPSWTQQLANVFGKYVAGKVEDKALNQYKDFQKNRTSQLSDLLRGQKVEEAIPGTEEMNMPGMVQETYKPYSREEFLSKATGIMPELGDEMVKAQVGAYFKEDQPIQLGEGGVLVNRKGDVIARNPKTPKFSDKYSNIKVDEQTGRTFGINNESMKVEEIPGSVLTPKPAAAPTVRTMRQGSMELTQQWDPAKNTWTTVAQGPAFKPEAPTKLKEPPPTARQAYYGNVASIQQIDDAIEAVKKSPDTYFGLHGALGNEFMSRVYPESVDVRQKVTGVGAAKRHELSGSAVTPSENKATAPLLPQQNDDKKTVLKKLQGLRENYATLNNSIAGSFGEEYAPLSRSQNAQPSAPAAGGEKMVPVPRLKAGGINEKLLVNGLNYEGLGKWNAKARHFE